MEIFDIVDENGNPTGNTVERSKAHEEGIRHRTSHVWLFRTKADKLQILLQKRCSSKDSYPGCYDISSAGHIPAGVGFVASALRELKEELGVTATAEELEYVGYRRIQSDTVFRGHPFHDRQFSRIFLMWENRNETDFICQPEEVECVLWMDFNAAYQAVESNSITHCITMEEMNLLKAYLTETRRL